MNARFFILASLAALVFARHAAADMGKGRGRKHKYFLEGERCAGDKSHRINYMPCVKGCQCAYTGYTWGKICVKKYYCGFKPDYGYYILPQYQANAVAYSSASAIAQAGALAQASASSSASANAGGSGQGSASASSSSQSSASSGGKNGSGASASASSQASASAGSRTH